MSLLIFGFLFAVSLQDGFQLSDLVFVAVGVVLFCLELKSTDNDDFYTGY